VPVKDGARDDLKWSYPEIKEIKKSVRNIYKCYEYTGVIASEENFKRAFDTIVPDILHISVHGFSNTTRLFLENQKTVTGLPYFRSENPLFNCGLVMAEAGNPTIPVVTHSDGFLTGYEIAMLPLDNAGLVVLSACETGLGNIWQSEGVFGLQRAFKLAGARKIIMSLWDVGDKPTYELMTQFYHLLADGKTVDIAFEQAQKIIRGKYPSPYFWAGFVLIE
jgi:CHAT domain-containing protein